MTTASSGEGHSNSSVLKELHFNEHNLVLAGARDVMMYALLSEIRGLAAQFDYPSRAFRLMQHKVAVRQRNDQVVMLMYMPASIVALCGKAPFGHADPVVLNENRAVGSSFAGIRATQRVSFSGGGKDARLTGAKVRPTRP